MHIKINEIFQSIQGESTYAGIPCTFVRLTGCNLRCAYCDTRYAYEDGTEMELIDIVSKVSDFNCPVIEITGGEPLLQKNTPLLIDLLLKNGFKVLLETNGSVNIHGVDPRCIKIVDIKCPSSNEKDKTDLNNLTRLTENDQVKFVIADQTDYNYAKKIVKDKCKNMPHGNILFSPVTGVQNPRKLAEWILADNLKVRLHLQLHKILWPDEQRGV